MLHPDTELRPTAERIGVGVFATRPLPRGTIVWTLDRLDQVFPPGGLEALGSHYAPILDRYAYRNGQGAWVLCWDLARFVNHSCEANALSTGWDFDVAVRDIAAGEEITNDYASLNLDAPFRCWCGAQSCRGWVQPDDFERWADRWDELVRAAFAETSKVDQPLWRWLPNKRQVRSAFTRIERLPSPQRHRFAPPAPAAVDDSVRAAR